MLLSIMEKGIPYLYYSMNIVYQSSNKLAKCIAEGILILYTAKRVKLNIFRAGLDVVMTSGLFLFSVYDIIIDFIETQ